MRLSTAKIYKMCGLDAYKDKYGEFIHAVSTVLLEKQIEQTSRFITENIESASEKNYIICIEINNELFIRELWEKCNRGEKSE